jgi:type II secretory pathway component GspD/PulD (secretin)
MYLLATCVAAASQPGEIPFAFANEPLVNAVDRVATRFGAHAVFVGDVDGRVTARFSARDLREALDAVVHAPYRYRIVRGGVIVDQLPASAPAPANAVPIVLKPRVIDVQRAADLISGLFPGVRTRADARTGSVIVFAPSSRALEIQAAFESIDTKGTTTRSVQAFHVLHADPVRVAATLRRLFPGIRIESAPNRSLIVSGSGQDLTDVGAVITGVDSAAAPPAVPTATESVTVTEARPVDVARAVAAATGVRAAVSGQSVVLSGPPEAIARAKTLVAQMDIPSANVRYSQVYRLHFIDAASVAALVRRTFRSVAVEVDPTLNAFTAVATTAEQLRIGDAVAQTADTRSESVRPPCPRPTARWSKS